MQDNKLLASVVLFRELYDSNKDIYDVIGELLKSAITFEKKWSFNTTEATQLLETTFGFQIPESVIKTTLRNRLKKQEKILSFSDGIYTLEPNEIGSYTSLSSELESTKNKQDSIISGLVSYIENLTLRTIDDEEKSIIIDNFSAFLLDDYVDKKYSDYISSYIIEKQSEVEFTESLNAVREGFVLYNGVRYSPDLNDIGIWKTELTIYLDTEHLFNSAGFNGILHKQLFDDFYNLVKEINHGGKKVISLKFFAECKDEIDGFFHVAELIVDGKFALDPSKNAMISILNGCKTKGDILSKQASFYSKLNSMHIKQVEEKDFSSEYKYNIESEKLIQEIKSQVEDSGRYFDKEKCIKILKTFTKINTIRKGVNSGAFEKIGFILLSGNNFTRFLAFNPSIKTNGKDIPFATDIDFITNRFWFKLKKGLTNSNSLPKSLSVVAKAQVVLSSHIKNTVSDQFDSMKKNIANGSVSEKDAEYLHHELRTKVITPENITPDTIKDALKFLRLEGFDEHLREKSMLERKAADGEKAIDEINAIRQEKEKRKKNIAITILKIKFTLIIALLISFIVAFYGVSFYLIDSYRESDDSNLTIFGIMLSLAMATIPLLKYKIIISMFVDKLEKIKEN